jgi:hypothetical protein
LGRLVLVLFQSSQLYGKVLDVFAVRFAILAALRVVAVRGWRFLRAGAPGVEEPRSVAGPATLPSGQFLGNKKSCVTCRIFTLSLFPSLDLGRMV